MTSPWYRCFPRDFNEGMVGLTLEERGAYITLLNLIYARGGPIPEDAWWITSQLGCTKRAWVKLRAALIVKGKVFALNADGADCLMNARAAVEIAEREEFSKNRAEAGKKGGRKSRPKPNENNDNSEAELKLSLSKTEAIHIHSHRGSVASPDGEPTGADTPNGKAWNQATSVLVAQGQMTIPAAKAFFGKLLSGSGLEASELLGAIGEAEHLRTSDPQGFLTRAAQARNRKRQTGPPKRVSFV